MIKAIFLDFEGVVTENGQFIHTLVADLCKDKISYEELNERYSQASISNLTFDEFQKGLPKDWLEKSVGKIVFHKGTKEFLDWAKDKYPLYIASNNIPVLCEKELDHLKIRKLFKKIFISCYMKKKKPNEDFFKEILKESNEKLPALFVDDAKRNLVVAKEIGFTTVWVNNTKTNLMEDKRNQIDYNPDYEIEDLREIISIIEKLNSP
ncbi:MAG: HAD family hydrolase [archaeon]|jgi:HAD superfamily hydrolase (TIGR01509 family)